MKGTTERVTVGTFHPRNVTTILDMGLAKTIGWHIIELSLVRYIRMVQGVGQGLLFNRGHPRHQVWSLMIQRTVALATRKRAQENSSVTLGHTGVLEELAPPNRIIPEIGVDRGMYQDLGKKSQIHLLGILIQLATETPDNIKTLKLRNMYRKNGRHHHLCLTAIIAWHHPEVYSQAYSSSTQGGNHIVPWTILLQL